MLCCVCSSGHSCAVLGRFVSTCALAFNDLVVHCEAAADIARLSSLLSASELSSLEFLAVSICELVSGCVAGRLVARPPSIRVARRGATPGMQ